MRKKHDEDARRADEAEPRAAAARPRIVDAALVEDDAALRPRSFDEYVGQRKVVDNLKVFVAAAQRRGEALDHVLFSRPARHRQDHAGAPHRRRARRHRCAPSARRPSSTRARSRRYLTSLEPRGVLFIDEVHRLQPVVEEYLYPAMEDFRLEIPVGDGPNAEMLPLKLPRFSLVGATTRTGLLVGAVPRRASASSCASTTTRRTSSPRSCAARRRGSASRSTPAAPRRSAAARAARRASPTTCCGACATSPRWRATGASRRRVAAGALDPPRRRRARPRRARPHAAARDHPEVRRRPGRRRVARRRLRRGARHARGRLRAVPHPGGLPACARRAGASPPAAPTSTSACRRRGRARCSSARWRRCARARRRSRWRACPWRSTAARPRRAPPRRAPRRPSPTTGSTSGACFELELGDEARQRRAAEARHHHVEQHHVGRVAHDLRRDAERRGAGVHRVAAMRQQLRHHVEHRCDRRRRGGSSRGFTGAA